MEQIKWQLTTRPFNYVQTSQFFEKDGSNKTVDQEKFTKRKVRPKKKQEIYFISFCFFGKNFLV